MQLSYLLLFLYLLIIAMGLVCSTNHVLKSGVCCVVSGGITAIYLYLEHSFANLNSYKAMRAYFYYLLLPSFEKKGISEASGNQIAGAIYVFIVFLVIFIIMYLILTLVSFGGAPNKSKSNRGKKAIFLVLYYASWIFIFTYFFASITPVFTNYPVGFLQSLLDKFRWEIV